MPAIAEYFGLVQTVGPFDEPVSRQEAKDHLRIETTADDSTTDALIRTARDFIEEYVRRQLVVATWKLTLDEFPEWEIVLPRGTPLISVSSVQYVDLNGATQTIAASDYQVVKNQEPGYVCPVYNESWPTAREQPEAVTVTYLSGYATPFTVNATTNILTTKGRNYSTNDLVRVWNTGGALPAGLSANTDYYVISAAGSTMKLSLTQGGGEIDITDVGTGTHFLGEIPDGLRIAIKLLFGHWFENRELMTLFPGQHHPLPGSLIGLLSPYQVGEYF